MTEISTEVVPSEVGRFRGHGALLTALVVDGAGSGLFLPFAVLYFLHTTTIPLASVGGALTAGGLLALPTPLLVGPLIDRFGPRRLTVAGNLLSVVAFLGYLFVGSTWQLAAAALIAGVGQSASWTALVCLIGLVAAPDERPRWFAVQSVARNAGYGLGGIAGAVTVSVGAGWAYPLLAAVNAASYVVVAGVVALRLNTPAQYQAGPARDPAMKAAGYFDVIRDRRLLVLVGTNFLLVVCMSVLSVLVTVYLVDALGQPAWVGGALFTLNTVIVVLAQTTVTRRVDGCRKPKIVQVAAAAWALAFLFLWLLNVAPGWLVLPGAALAVCACTLAEMLHAPTINALAVDTAPSMVSGRYLATYQLSWGLGTAVAPGLLSWLLSRGAQWPWPVLIVLCALAAAAIGLLLKWTENLSAKTKT
ncbi:MFS transporter [Amycolatopsis sp. H20-H5]|uniref:MFS transporter n=1 Tax=Amycolatopsis sp. H20-H5 TaxID=3046309 RepID=UPI002DB55B28|nr:MFS transporter [Amycolatopsis sp. H20-H5]MEC3978049.1 MFS transporter [Amycolatopsis sp. H20-H5]